MFTAYVVVTIVTIIANTAIVIGDLAGADIILANMAEVGIPASWLRPLALLKAAGVLGLLIGLLGVRFLGIAAAAGLVLFFVGAVTTHVRARVFHNIGFPIGFLALATASLTLALAT